MKAVHLLVALLVLSGCSKSDPPKTEPTKPDAAKADPAAEYKKKLAEFLDHALITANLLIDPVNMDQVKDHLSRAADLFGRIPTPPKEMEATHHQAKVIMERFDQASDWVKVWDLLSKDGKSGNGKAPNGLTTQENLKVQGESAKPLIQALKTKP